MAIKNGSLDEFANMIWGKRLEGLPVPELKLKDEITPQELQNIYQKFAYGQILNPESRGEFSEIKFSRARSGWLILNYRNAIASAPGEKLFDHGTYISSDAGELQRICTGTGTRVMQIINTAADMVRIAIEEERWPAIQIVNGHSLMTWGIWKAAKDLQIEVMGYVPSKEEEEKYNRIQGKCPLLIIHPSTPGNVPNK